MTPRIDQAAELFGFLGNLKRRTREVLDKIPAFRLVRELRGRPDVTPHMLDALNGAIADLEEIRTFIDRYANPEPEL